MKLLIATLCLVSFSSCNYDQLDMTPEQRAKVEQLDAKIEADKATAKQHETAATDALKQNDLATFEAEKAQFAALTQKMVEENAERNAMLKQATTSKWGGLFDLINTLVPGIPKPVSEILLGVGVPLLFKRPREHAGDALKSITEGALGDVVSSIAKMYGLKHTNDTSEELIGVAKSLALKEENPALATKLDTVLKTTT
jgi:hypothetical protein